MTQCTVDGDRAGHLIIISGPSGAGKGTIVDALLKINPENLDLSVSCTTRKPRINEKDGVNYYFITEGEFKSLIEKDNFLEYANVFGAFYGTPKDKVLEKLHKGINVILEIDVQGALKVKQNYDDAVMIFIMPPSKEELWNRLKGRATETPEQIEKRISKAQTEMDNTDKYDFVVINDKLEEAIEEVSKIIKDLK